MSHHEPGSGTSTQLPPRWAGPVRAAWLVMALLLVSIWAVGSYDLLRGPYPDCSRVACDFIEFSAEDARILEQLDLPRPVNARTWTAIQISYSLTFFALAGLIFWRRGHDWMALLVGLTLIYLAAMLFTASDDVVRRSRPTLSTLYALGDTIGLSSFMVLLLTFPRGRTAPPWTGKIIAPLFALGLLAPLVLLSSTRLQGPDIPPWLTLIWLLNFMGMIALGLYSQIYRYRHVSSANERQQTKWVLFGFSGALIIVPLWSYIGLAFPPSEPSSNRALMLLLGTPLILLISSLLPFSLAISILRYRLLDIDQLINRSLVYGALTGALAVVFYAGVVFIQFILWAVTGSELAAIQPPTLVLATLGTAALFAPLRRRIQSGIDRRFYRRKYDAARTLASFAEALREPIELDQLKRELVSTVAETIQPRFVSLWFSRKET